MRILAKYLIFVSVVFLSIHAEAGTSSNCDAPEVIDFAEGYKDYNNFLCSGIAQMKEEKYSDAVSSFKSALSIRLFEIPNFELYSRLAMAHFKAGDIENAKRSLLAAELSLSILIGVLTCVEVDVEDFGVSYIVVNEYGDRLSGDVLEEVVNKMCGAAYDYYYDQSSFAVTLSNAELIKRYLAAKKSIESHAQSPE